MTLMHPIFDQHRLDELFAIGAMTPDFFVLLSESFGQASHDSIAAIEHACQTADHRALHRAAHALKGSAATFGAPRLAARAAKLEECGRLVSALPPIESFAELRELADAAYALACEWATKKGITLESAAPL